MPPGTLLFTVSGVNDHRNRILLTEASDGTPTPKIIFIVFCSKMSTGTLFIRDSRTNANYEIPINRNAVRATDLQGIWAPSLNSNRADQVVHGLRVYDPGLQNTAVTESAISFS